MEESFTVVIQFIILSLAMEHRTNEVSQISQTSFDVFLNDIKQTLIYILEDMEPHDTIGTIYEAKKGKVIEAVQNLSVKEKDIDTILAHNYNKLKFRPESLRNSPRIQDIIVKYSKKMLNEVLTEDSSFSSIRNHIKDTVNQIFLGMTQDIKNNSETPINVLYTEKYRSGKNHLEVLQS